MNPAPLRRSRYALAGSGGRRRRAARYHGQVRAAARSSRPSPRNREARPRRYIFATASSLLLSIAVLVVVAAAIARRAHPGKRDPPGFAVRIKLAVVRGGNPPPVQSRTRGFASPHYPDQPPRPEHRPWPSTSRLGSPLIVPSAPTLLQVAHRSAVREFTLNV
jgi:hypothetical protein